MTGRWSTHTVRSIRDPIFGYLYLNEGEARFVESPYFQRLRYIKQDSTAYLTYPSATGSRFEHSLGVAHLAGRMIDAALHNSSPTFRRKLVAGCFTELQRDWGDKIAGVDWSAYAEPDAPVDQPPTQEAEAMVRAMVRVAALAHDLGHPPFSHIFEGVLQRLVTEGHILDDQERRWFTEPIPLTEGHDVAYHERASYRILDLNGDGRSGSLFTPDSEDSLVRFGAMRVLKPHKADIAFDALHELIDSDLDADRGEYLLRDGSLSGIGYGRYDEARLTGSLRLCEHKGRLLIRPSTAALSAVESLLEERLKLYKYLYFHNYVMFTDELLTMLMEWLLDPATARHCAGAPDLKVLQDFLTKEVDLKRFSYLNYVSASGYVDDTYVMELLRETLRILSAEPVLRLLYASMSPITWLRPIHAALRALLLREKCGASLWKEYPEWVAFHEEHNDHLRQALVISRANRLRPDHPKDAYDRAEKEVQAQLAEAGGRVLNYIGEQCHRDRMVRLSLSRALEPPDASSWSGSDYSIIIATRGFAPVKPKTLDYVLVQDDNVPAALGTLSPYLEILPASWAKDIHVRVYALLHIQTDLTPESRQTARDKAQQMVNQVRNELPKRLGDWIAGGEEYSEAAL